MPPVQRPTASRRKRGGRKVALMLGVGLLGTVGVVVGANADLRKGVVDFFSTKRTDLIPYVVKKSKLVITVTERGAVESGKNEDVSSEVEGQTTILMILPEGTPVKKGDLVCELDSAGLRDNRVNQEIATERARADLENATKTLEVAKYAVKEYLEGTYQQQVADIRGEQTLAASELARAEERYRWSQDMLSKNYISEGQVIADRLAELRSRIQKEQAERKMKVLQEFTYPKELTELQANVAKAESDELAKRQTFDLEKTKLERLVKQIDKTKLYAPNDGLIVYANDTNQFRGNNQPLVEEGAVVRERQKIFSLPDLQNMQVNTKVHESMVDRVKPRQQTKIRVDAFGNMELHGTVKNVAPLPDPSSFFSSDIKVYTTIVNIDQTVTQLRPGMTAQVTIHINTLEDVLTVPVTAVLPLSGKDYVYLLTAEGPVRQVVKLGETNDILIEIMEGLKEGDRVAMNPQALLSEDEKREAFSASARAEARAKDFGDAKPVSPGVEGEKGAAPGKGAERKKGARGGAGGGMPGMPAFASKLQSLSPEDRTRMRDPSLSEADREELLKKAGLTDDEIGQMRQMMEQMKSGGGMGGGPGGPGGPPGGGFGGGGPR